MKYLGGDNDMRLPQEDICTSRDETVFDRCSWLYALCRERIFTDHTRSIADRFREVDPTQQRRVLLEVGCGPGFYSLRLAEIFPHFEVIGLDPSARLLEMARKKALKRKLPNCRFLRARAQHLIDFPATVDFILASRLLFILSNKRPAFEAMYQALRPSGFLFIAEPLSPLRTRIPVTAMRLMGPSPRASRSSESEPSCSVLTKSEFASFIHSLPWKRVEHWFDRGYQYALCEKPF